MKPRKPEASLPDCNVEAADALMEIFGFKRQETYYALCDAVWEMGLAQSRGQAKRLCIQGAITVNGKLERDPWRSVCRFDEVAKRDHKGG